MWHQEHYPHNNKWINWTSSKFRTSALWKLPWIKWRDKAQTQRTIVATHISDEDFVSRILKGHIKRKWITRFLMAKYLNRYFTEDVQMAKKCVKRCSMSYVIGEMQIQMTVRSHCTSIRKSTVEKILHPSVVHMWRNQNSHIEGCVKWYQYFRK